LDRNQVPLSGEIRCRFRPKSSAGLLRFLQEKSCQRLERLCRLKRDAASPQHKARKRQLKVFKPDDEPS